jgi:hypothetical protein
MKQPNLDALNDYIRANRGYGFQWHTNDCFVFTNNCFRAMYGIGYADDWLCKYTKNGIYLSREKLRKRFGANTLYEALETKLTRVDGVPPRGSLVTTKAARRWVINDALGISIGSSAVFLGKQSLEALPIETITSGWVLE